MKLATLFLLLFSICLTLSPVVRYQSWDAPLKWVIWIGFFPWLGLFAYTHRQTIKSLPNRDPFLLPLGAFLSGLGLLVIWRLSTSFGLRQTIWFVICMVVLNILLRFPNILKYLRRYKYIWLTTGLALTLSTFFFGTYPGGNGPHLWLGCCGVYFQPSEPLKLLLIAYLAAFLADRMPSESHLVQLFFPTLLLTGLVLALLLAQRDLGTVILFTLIYFSILYLATGRRRVVLVSGVILILVCILGYNLFSVVHTRIDSWLNPWIDPSNRSYQIVQSLITISSGGILGRGPGLGNPSLVPVAQSDFIFSAISEETGLLGSVGLVLMVCLFAVRGLKVALQASDLYQRYLATGLIVYISAQSLLIIGGNLNVFPLTGITLPFVSYGGSSLLTSFISLILLLLISNRSEPAPIRPQQQTPYLQIGAVLVFGCAVIILVDSWWAVWDNQNLLYRTDNPRLSLSNSYVKRGEIFDRDGNVLVDTNGTPGEFTSNTTYPPLSPVLGYTDPIYGQAGLENTLNSYLRGFQGDSQLTTFWNELIYGQPPPGLDVKLSLSLGLQKQADTLLANNSGAVVMLNAQSGEVLVMASHPFFDANTLSQNWSQLTNDPAAPLINRATQGLYPPGTALGPFFLARVMNLSLPTAPVLNDYSYSVDNTTLNCSFLVQTPTWGNLIGSGCPEAILRLTAAMDSQRLNVFYQTLGFFSVPGLSLPSDSSSIPTSISDLNLYALGEEKLDVSPLQMALAAAALTSNGKQPKPIIALSVDLPNQGWSLLNQLSTPVQVLPADQVINTVDALSVSGFLGWQSVGTALTTTGKPITWYIGGTLPSWQGTPIAITVLLEQNNPALAVKIGQTLITSAQNP